RLNAYETGIAGSHAFPGAYACVIASPGSNHIVRTVPAKAKLRERSEEVGAPLHESFQGWHVGFFPRRCGVVAYIAHFFASVAVSTVLPAIGEGDFQAAVF